MTDPEPGGAEAPAKPIVVKATAKEVVAPELLKWGLTLASVYAVQQAFTSDVTRTAALAAAAGVAGLVATFVWSLRQRLHAWAALRFLARRAPDSVAVVGKVK
jgi:hypothetical protein